MPSPVPTPRWRFAVFAALLLLPVPALAQGAGQPATETIVLVRHGEKPAKGLGQLDCQGLNRALALPAVIGKMFGRPDAVFAPDPAQQAVDHGVRYDYIRPLATIEPTAIAFGLPVDTQFGLNNTWSLVNALEAPGLHHALVLVGWEHHAIEDIARQLLHDNGGNPKAVPTWANTDFDSIYVIRITRSGTSTTATFSHAHEGLDGQPTSCPH